MSLHTILFNSSTPQKLSVMKKILSILALVLLITQVHAQQLPRVIILATGGTIAGAGASSDRAGYTAGKIPD
jgi:L-asparaginase